VSHWRDRPVDFARSELANPVSHGSQGRSVADCGLHQAASLLLYQSVLQSGAGQAFLQLLQAIRQFEDNRAPDALDCLSRYGEWFRTLATLGQSWQDYLLTGVLQDDNPFTRQAQSRDLNQMPASLVAAAQQDLAILQQFYQCQPQQIAAWVRLATQQDTPPIAWNPLPQNGLTPLRQALESIPHWSAALPVLTTHYRQSGVGLFARDRAYRWHQGQLIGIACPDPIRLSDLAGYESQKQAVLKNTEFLLRGLPALNVLLYGSRGSGKSSLIKGLLTASLDAGETFGDRGLRLVEVAKSELQALPAIVAQVRSRPQKFILFVDDLSFEADDDAYKALKVLLEGSLTARPQNVAVYATSNRRHLIREFFSDRPRPSDQEEIHAWDTMQEKLSFSDRFGLTLTFEPADQSTYLQIVHHLAQQAAISLPPEDLDFRALQWATRHNGRSGRTARQFIDFLRADLSLI